MGLSKRERIIVLTTVLVVGALVADKFVITPLWEGLGQLQEHRRQSRDQVTKAKNLLALKPQKEEQYQKLLKNGMASDAEAESRGISALDQWSKDAGLMLSSVKPDRTVGDKGLKEIVFTVAGKGSLDAVAWFLYQVETAELPLKVKYMQLGSTSEAGDSMSLELRLSTLYVAAATDEKSSRKQVQPKQEKNNDDQILQ
jgi:Tfp pilus assembly protein PilO